jgi:hypothetical protein
MKAKSSGLISLIYGFLGCGVGAFSLLMIYVGQKMLGDFKSTGDQILRMRIYFTALHDTWLTYMPLMIIIGFIYVLSGWLLKKEKKEGISVGILAAILNLLWFVGYAVSLNTNVLPIFPRNLRPAEQTFAIAIAGIFMCLYPLYFLFTFKRIKLNRK